MTLHGSFEVQQQAFAAPHAGEDDEVTTAG